MSASSLSENDRFSTTNDCWTEICTFLNCQSRARCESLCRTVSEFVTHFWTDATFFDVSEVRPSSGCTSAWISAIIGASLNIGDSLRWLRMCATPMMAATFSEIVEQCPNVERIDAFIADLSLAHFDKLEKLRVLNLIGDGDDLLFCLLFYPMPPTPKLPATLEVLTGVRGLREYNVSCLNMFFAEHPNLTHFELSNSDKLFGAPAVRLFETIAQSCPRMEHLVIAECGDANLAGIELFTNLTFLNISTTVCASGGCQLSDEQVSKICSRNPRLRSARIAYRDQDLSMPSAEAIATLSCLEELEISHPYSDEYLKKILEGVPSLRQLSIRAHSGLTDSSIDALGGCPNLRVFVVRGTMPVFSVAALRRLIDAVAVSENFDPMKESFEVYLDQWEYSFAARSEYAQLVAALPAGVVVRRFDSFAKKFLLNTIVPGLDEG